MTVYGKTMAEGEAAVRGLDPAAAVLRISLPMGPSFNGHAGAIDWIQSRFRPGRPATLYFDEVRSPTYCDDLNRVFERLLAGNEAGLFHCGGPRSVTLYQIGQIVNRVGGYDPALLRGLPAARRRADAAAGRQRQHEQRQADRGAGRRPVPPLAAGRRPVAGRRPPLALRGPSGEGGSPALLAARLYRYPGADGAPAVDAGP